MQKIDDKTFYTETMARLLNNQGHHHRAAEIYRYLLEKAPDREDLKAALDDTEARIGQGTATWGDVSGVVARWVELMLRLRALKRLERLSIPRIAGDGPGAR